MTALRVRSQAILAVVTALCGILLLSTLVPTAHATANPVPLIMSISPISAVPGAADFTLTVNGANFVPTSKVNWGTTVLTTTYVSATQLTATVTASLIAGSGTGWITVVTPGGPASNLLFLPVANSSSSVALLGQSYATGSGPRYGVAADFNKDGKQDIVVSNTSSNTISILLGIGDGTFQTQVTFPAGITSPWGVFAADVNNDGNLDLVVGTSSGTNMAILLGNGDGTFQTATTTSSTGGSALNPVLADVNADGALDIVVGCNNGTVAVLLGNGDGTFAAATPLADTAGTRVWALAVGDVNNDGKLDIVAGSNGTGSLLDIFLGNGDGTFQAPTTLDSTLNIPLSPTLADLNGDGIIDIAVPDETGGQVAVLLGSGAGAFQPAALVPVGGSPLTVSVGDINGDGKLDLATPGAVSGSIAIALGNGDGTFQTAQTFGASNFSYSAFLGNFATSGGLGVVVPVSFGSTVLVLQPTVTISPSTFDFGSIGVLSPSAPHAFTVTNSTASTVTISGLSFTGANSSDFTETDTCNTPVASGATCVVNVTLTPAAAGSRTATLSIADDAPGSPHTATVSGTGVAAPVVQLSGALLAFGNENDGATSSSQSVTVTNIGTADLTGIAVSIAGTNSSEFAQTNTCGTILTPSSVCSITVTFSPSTTGSKTASVQVADNAADSPQSISLTGTGVALVATATLSSTALSFNNQAVGTSSSAQAFTVTNTGNTPLTGIIMALAGTNASDFSKTTTCSGTLAASASCSISVTFAPGTPGQKAASVSITDGAANSPQAVTLSGTGVASDYAVSVNPASLTIQAGQTGTATFTITPVGGYSGLVQFTCNGLPSGATCVFQPAQSLLDGSNTAVAVQLVVHTTGANGVLSTILPIAPFGSSPYKLAAFPISVGLVAFILIGTLRTRQIVPRRCLGALVLIIGCAIGVGLAGCGSTKAPVTSSGGTPAGQYSVNVTAAVAAGSNSHASALTITITQ